PLPPHARPEGVAPEEAILVEFGADLEHPLNIERLVRIISRMCSDHGVTAGHLSYTVVGDEEMHRLNREALNHDYTTDVISFDYTEPAERGSWIEGEVIVNA